jgi:hypothetical protein
MNEAGLKQEKNLSDSSAALGAAELKEVPF